MLRAPILCPPWSISLPLVADPYPPWTPRCTSSPPPFPFMHCYWRKKISALFDAMPVFLRLWILPLFAHFWICNFLLFAKTFFSILHPAKQQPRCWTNFHVHIFELFSVQMILGKIHICEPPSLHVCLLAERGGAQTISEPGAIVTL